MHLIGGSDAGEFCKKNHALLYIDNMRLAGKR